MTGDSHTPGTGSRPTVPAVPRPGSGEGAGTALEALIRKRKMVEKPDSPQEPKPPAPPPA
jgi:hypothetical protein